MAELMVAEHGSVVRPEKEVHINCHTEARMHISTHSG